ncbi:hypothetical protein GCM10010052_19100 [Paenarthrobacter histidinolovorans]|nr:hypothetical protein GCM10010052_19100 [Paenarthrobacter histidinolovorans]
MFVDPSEALRATLPNRVDSAGAHAGLTLRKRTRRRQSVICTESWVVSPGTAFRRIHGVGCLPPLVGNGVRQDLNGPLAV